MPSLAALCIAAAGFHVVLPVSSFTLRWQHSIEKVEWAEDWEVAGGWLHLSQARIRGSGAGMEPPHGAMLVDGVWRYSVPDPWRREVVLARSEFVADYELCLVGQRCRPLSHWVPIAAGPTRLSACKRGLCLPGLVSGSSALPHQTRRADDSESYLETRMSDSDCR